MRTAVLTSLLAGVCLAGCGGSLGFGPKFTRPRFDTLHEGMSPEQVRDKLGEPDRVDGDTWVYLRQRPAYQRADIRFDTGRLAEKRWSYQPPDDSPGRLPGPPGGDAGPVTP